MSLSFAASEYIEYPTNAIFNDTSFSVAFRWKSSTGGQWEILGKHQAATSFNGFNFNTNGASPNRMQASAKAGSGSGFGCSDATVNASDGNWHNAVGRFVRSASGTIDLMVDGTSATQSSGNPAWDPTGQVLRLARSVDGFWTDYVGEIADLAWWNVRLTADEARAFCQGCSPGAIRPGALKLWLPFRY